MPARTFRTHQLSLTPRKRSSWLQFLVASPLVLAALHGNRVSAQQTPPPIQWTRLYGAQNSYIDDAKMAVDSFGNTYAGGGITGTFTGNTSAGGKDAYLVKFDRQGNFQWARQWGTAGNDKTWGVAVDDSGCPYAVGWEADVNHNRQIAFIRKYDAGGTLVWFRMLAVQVGAAASDIAISRNGCVYVTGYASRPQNPNGNPYSFLAKFDTSANHYWTHTIGDPSSGAATLANAITLDCWGHVYVGGSMQGILNGQQARGFLDGFVIKFDSDGVEKWTRVWLGSGVTEARAVAVDACGHVFLAGGTYSLPVPTQKEMSMEAWYDKIERSQDKPGRAPASTGTGAFLAKYHAHGALLWETRPGFTDDITRLVVGTCNRLYLSGFGYGAELQANSGAVNWRMQLPFFCRGLARSCDGSLYFHGSVHGPFNGQPAIGSSDGYVVKLAPGP